MRAYPRNRANINGFNGDEVFGKHKANERTGVAVYILFARAGIEDNMGPRGSSWIRRRAEQAMKIGLLRAYRGVGVNPDRYLKHLRRAYGLHVTSFREMNTVPLPVVITLPTRPFAPR